VFLVGCEEGMLPSFGEGEGRALTEVRLEEERRLMYVGVTRAQRSLHITWCKKRKKGRDFAKREPSRFLAELQLEEDKHLPDETPTLSPKERLAALMGLLK
jgi:ATP-dependent DNA helicase Rep